MKFLKFLLIFIGGSLIGFGIGIIIGNNSLFTNTTFWSSAIGSLILGGFFMALGLVISGRKKEKKEEIREIKEVKEINSSASSASPTEQNPPVL